MTPDETRPGEEDGDGVLDRRRVGTALGVGAVVVVLYHLAALLHSALVGPGGLDRGAVWTILLMILVTFGTVGVIGWGLYRAVRDGDGVSDSS